MYDRCYDVKKNKHCFFFKTSSDNLRHLYIYICSINSTWTAAVILQNHSKRFGSCVKLKNLFFSISWRMFRVSLTIYSSFYGIFVFSATFHLRRHRQQRSSVFDHYIILLIVLDTFIDRVRHLCSFGHFISANDK